MFVQCRIELNMIVEFEKLFGFEEHNIQICMCHSNVSDQYKQEHFA